MTGDKAIRAATAAVVAAVAAFAAVVSYTHVYDLGRAHGQAGTAARLLPLSVDGLILAASLVLLHEARNHRRAPGLARVMLWSGVGATVAANAAYGWPYGPVGVVVSAWPAVAFVGSVELVMGLVRRARPASHPAATAATVAATAEEAARAALAASAAAGSPLSQRAVAARFGLSRNRAGQLAREVTAAANGHGDTP
jgi:hypothetical protein